MLLQEISLKNFEQAIERVVAGMEKKSQVTLPSLSLSFFSEVDKSKVKTSDMINVVSGSPTRGEEDGSVSRGRPCHCWMVSRVC